MRGEAAAAKVRPLDASGKPSKHGKIVLLSIGMSNAAYEFSTFQLLAHAQPDVNPALEIVNGAIPSATADPVSNPQDPYSAEVQGRLQKADVTAPDVQAIWLKEAIRDEDRPYPTDANALEHDLQAIISILTQRFPNLQADLRLQPNLWRRPNDESQPGALCIRQRFRSEVARRRAHREEHARTLGRVGPLPWTDGTKGRKDGLVWTCADVEQDGTHPSEQGRQKIANLLLSFFEHNKTTRWFVKRGSGSSHGSVMSNLRYGTVGGEPLLLDAYVARHPKTRRPGVILIHGGGWDRGDKATFAAEGQKLAKLGWDAFSINYRLDPPAQFPASINDSLKAVRWIRAHARRFHLNPKKLAVIGSSAGGNLAALLAVDGHGSRTKGSRVLAAVTWSAPMNLATLRRITRLQGLPCSTTWAASRQPVRGSIRKVPRSPRSITATRRCLSRIRPRNSSRWRRQRRWRAS